MRPFTAERVVYDGSDPSDSWIITEIGHKKIDASTVDIVNLQSIDQYENGCRQHENCLGHICRTPYGSLLPFHSLAISTPTVRNDIFKAARYGFQSPSQYHQTKCREQFMNSMKTKTGRMRRGILNCHIDGSLRMVISPLDDSYDRSLFTDTDEASPKHLIAIPHYLQDKWKVVRLNEATNKYTADYVKEGDYAIALRPPVLSSKNIQPVKIVFWNQTCMGVSAEILKAFDGDYDGDEMQIYPVYDKDSIEECKKWTNTYNEQFERANRIYGESHIPFKGTNTQSFMDHTTISFSEIKKGAEQPLMAEETRTKAEHLNGFRQRYNTEEVSKRFLDEAIRGMGDTNKQQLSQPIVGDMSRIARLAASCVIHKDDETIGVCTRSDFVPIIKFKHDVRAGSPSVRGISTICAAFQQVALDSHHAKDISLPSHDMISDLIRGIGKTLVLFKPEVSIDRIKSQVKPNWITKDDSMIYAICDPHKLGSFPKSYIIGSYNPKVLSMIPREYRIETCSLAIRCLAKYYSLRLSDTELISLAVLYSYNPDYSDSPITTREGIVCRDLRWTETMMSNNYYELINAVNKENIKLSPIQTVSSCLMAGNFIDL